MLALVSTPEIHQSNIHHAAKAGHVLLTELLIAKGGEVNAQDEEGNTPIIVASAYGHVEVVDLLIQVGGDVNKQNESGLTPLHYASANDQVLERLIQAGGEVNTQSSDGWTPLHIASIGGHVEVITALLAAGADKTIKDNQGNTPHDHAWRHQDGKNALE